MLSLKERAKILKMAQDRKRMEAVRRSCMPYGRRTVQDVITAEGVVATLAEGTVEVLVRADGEAEADTSVHRWPRVHSDYRRWLSAEPTVQGTDTLGPVYTPWSKGRRLMEYREHRRVRRYRLKDGTVVEAIGIRKDAWAKARTLGAGQARLRALSALNGPSMLESMYQVADVSDRRGLGNGVERPNAYKPREREWKVSDLIVYRTRLDDGRMLTYRLDRRTGATKALSIK